MERHPHDQKPDGDGLLPKHGGYRRLKSFQVAQLVYDVTLRFCERFIDRNSRTHDQMVQAARSGVQNIAEGSVASGTSKKMELKLTNVAKASLEELRLDYEDFLRQRDLALWAPEDARRKALVARRCATADEVARWVRDYGLDGRDGRHGQEGQEGQSAASMKSISSMDRQSGLYAGATANAALVLIGVTSALLNRQIASQVEDFEHEGGFTERLYRRRVATRRNGKDT